MICTLFWRSYKLISCFLASPSFHGHERPGCGGGGVGDGEFAKMYPNGEISVVWFLNQPRLEGENINVLGSAALYFCNPPHSCFHSFVVSRCHYKVTQRWNFSIYSFPLVMHKMVSHWYPRFTSRRKLSGIVWRMRTGGRNILNKHSGMVAVYSETAPNAPQNYTNRRLNPRLI